MGTGLKILKLLLHFVIDLAFYLLIPTRFESSTLLVLAQIESYVVGLPFLFHVLTGLYVARKSSLA